MNNVPIPAELELAVPGSIPFFTVLLVISFILHLVFVMVMIGGTIVAVITEYLGIRYNNSRYDRLAQSVITITSINKSIAVVLGIAPLLLLSVLYTSYIYSSTVIIGRAWISIIPLVITAFLFLYAYKFKWESMQNAKGKHMLLGIAGAIPMLIVPLIFSTNMVLMLQPERWLETNGFWQAAMYPTVLPRYFHVLFACFAMIGIMIMMIGYWNGRKSTVAEELSYQRWAIQYGAKWAMYSVAGQLLVGPILLLMQPEEVRSSFLFGSNTWMLAVALVIISVVLYLLYLLSNRLTDTLLPISGPASSIAIEETAATGTNSFIGKYAWAGLLVSLCIVLFLMGTVRHQVREIQLHPYIAASADGLYQLPPLLDSTEKEPELPATDSEPMDEPEPIQPDEVEPPVDTEPAAEEPATEQPSQEQPSQQPTQQQPTQQQPSQQQPSQQQPIQQQPSQQQPTQQPSQPAPQPQPEPTPQPAPQPTVPAKPQIDVAPILNQYCLACHPMSRVTTPRAHSAWPAKIREMVNTVHNLKMGTITNDETNAIIEYMQKNYSN